MRYVFPVLCFIIVLSFGCTNKEKPQHQNVRLKLLGPISDVYLEKGYAYAALTANNHFLVWMEGYNHTIYIYNLAEKSIKKIKLKKGRGPHEFLQISGIAIAGNNIIYVVDNMNIKIIRLTIAGVFLKDRLESVGTRPERIAIGSGYKVVSDYNSQRSLFFLLKKNRSIPLKMSHYTQNKPRNFFKISGYSAIQGNDLIQVKKFLPYFYIYSLKEKRLKKKLVFDDNDVEWGQMIDGKKGLTIYPPKRVDFLNQNIARVPDSPHCIFLLAKGASKRRTYGLNKLFEYNYKKEKFVHTFKLPFKVQEITVNDHYLFAYSKEKNKIYRFKIVHLQK